MILIGNAIEENQNNKILYKSCYYLKFFQTSLSGSQIRFLAFNDVLINIQDAKSLKISILKRKNYFFHIVDTFQECHVSLISLVKTELKKYLVLFGTYLSYHFGHTTYS